MPENPGKRPDLAEETRIKGDTNIEDAQITEIALPANPLRGPETEQEGLKSGQIDVIDQFQELTFGSPEARKQRIDDKCDLDSLEVVVPQWSSFWEH